MKEAILDTSFILTCVKKKIDFIEELSLMGILPLIPIQVLKEIERVTKSNKKLHFRDDAKISLKILEDGGFKKIDLKQNYVDKGIKKFAESKRDVLIATLDKKLMGAISNKKIIITRGKILEIFD